MSVKNVVRFFLTFLMIAGTFHIGTASADQRTRLRIGGVGNVYFIDSTNLVGSASGTFAALSSVVHSMTPQADGTILASLTHNFVTADNGFIITDDVMVLVPVAGNPGIFTFRVEYTVKKSGNGLDGFEGQQFESRGFIDMNAGIAAVRYNGEIVRRKK